MPDRTKSVLVVEDDVELRELMELTLDAVGYRVVTAGEGRSALDQIEREMPAAILLDMRMPGMNGWEFAREFRTRYGHGAPIVVITAAMSARKQADEIEAEGYLDKPFELGDLIRTLERMFSAPPDEAPAAGADGSALNEAALVAAAASGDQTAFLQLYDRYYDRLYRYLFYRVSKAVDAEDLTQQVLLQVWSALGRYQQQGKPFSAWLFTIAHNAVVNFYRRSRSARNMLDAPLVGDMPESRTDGNPEFQAEAKWEAERIRAAIRHLKPIYQQVILLRFMEHMDCNEIAAIVGKTPANVRVMQFRGLQRMRQILEQDEI